MQQDSLLTANINKLRYTDEGRIARLDGILDSCMQNGDTSFALVYKILDSLSNNYSITHNTKVIYPLYIKQTRRSFKGYNHIETAIIRHIAKQCPMSGGPAVYMAQSMMRRIDTVPVNYTAFCKGSISNKTDEEKQVPILGEDLGTASFAIAPNPAKDLVNLTYNITETTQIILCDLTGRILKTITLQNGKGVYAIDVRGLATGTYILKAYSSQCRNCFSKLIQVIK